jgi:hypothetical protein
VFPKKNCTLTLILFSSLISSEIQPGMPDPLTKNRILTPILANNTARYYRLSSSTATAFTMRTA